MAVVPDARERAPADAGAAWWRDIARALRATQDMAGADAAIARAHALDPHDPLTTFLRAQSRYELGYPATRLFAEAARLWPGNPDITRNHALALASEGDTAGAETLLAAALVRRPDWLEGQRVLAELRFTAGEHETYAAGFADAVRAMPDHEGLWLGWFGAVSRHRDWPAAIAILDAARERLGKTPRLAIARAFIASESGDLAGADRLLAPLADVVDDFLALCRIRHRLRLGDVVGARDLALPLTGTPLAGQIWPYLSACWRLLDDPRARWLDGDPLLVAVVEPEFTSSEIADLAALLRRLHAARAPYTEQSVRGGTKTPGSLLLRNEPLLALARARLLAAVRDFVEALPPIEPAHPVLGRPRGRLHISGSWSVRLGGGGFNVSHSHPHGWLSSVFYVALPSPDASGTDAMGSAPAGWLTLGAPPAELGLDLEPYVRIEPRVGRLVIFPSLLWHGTEPTLGGERLNIAFDVVPATS